MVITPPQSLLFLAFYLSFSLSYSHSLSLSFNLVQRPLFIESAHGTHTFTLSTTLFRSLIESLLTATCLLSISPLCSLCIIEQCRIRHKRERSVLRLLLQMGSSKRISFSNCLTHLVWYICLVSIL